VNTVVIDPSAPYASGIRAALPHARIAVDHFHLVRLANEMVTDVRQRVAREQLGRRGTTADPAWVHRRMLLTAGNRLSPRQLRRLERALAADDPTNEIGAAWGVKELLRQLLAARDPADIRTRLWTFYVACATAQMPETTRLATTIETWWPHVLVFLQLGVTNARTEGFNRIIKQVKRTGCGFRNMDNYQRRIMSHIAVTRAALTPACGTTPVKCEEPGKSLPCRIVAPDPAVIRRHIPRAQPGWRVRSGKAAGRAGGLGTSPGTSTWRGQGGQ